MPLRRNRNWQRLWFAQAVSIVGDFVFNTTVVLWVGAVLAANQPWAPAAVSGVLLATGIPVLLVGPLAGVYVDRWNRRHVMMATDVLRGAAIAVLLLLPTVGHRWPIAAQLTMVYGLVAVVSAASQFFGPARFAVVAAAVPERDRPRAFGLSTATTSAAAVLGPPLAAPLLFSIGVQWALIVDVASYLLSFAAIWQVRVITAGEGGDREKTRFGQELQEGLRYFSRSRILVGVISSVCLYMLGVGSIEALNLFFVTDVLHSQARWLGTLEAAVGVGGVVGALVAGSVTRRLGDARVYAYGIIATAALTLIYSRSGTLVFAIAVLALSGISLACVNVALGPLVLSATPANMLGRINSVLNPLLYLSSVLSSAIAGFLASTVLRGFHAEILGMRFTPVDTIFAVASVLMLLAGVVAARALSGLLVRVPEGSADGVAVVPETLG